MNALNWISIRYSGYAYIHDPTGIADICFLHQNLINVVFNGIALTFNTLNQDDIVIFLNNAYEVYRRNKGDVVFSVNNAFEVYRSRSYCINTTFYIHEPSFVKPMFEPIIPD